LLSIAIIGGYNINNRHEIDMNAVNEEYQGNMKAIDEEYQQAIKIMY